MSATAADRRRHEPPAVVSVSQHVLQGTLDTQVQADLAYAIQGHIKFHLGPVFFVLKGREAALSMRELIDKLAPGHRRALPRPGRGTAAPAPRDRAAGSSGPPQPCPRQRHRTSRRRSSAPGSIRHHHTKTPVPGLGDCHPPARPARTFPLPREKQRRTGMSHATSAMPGREVVLDWRHGQIGPLAPCVLCGTAHRVPVPGQGRALPQGLRRSLDHRPRPRRSRSRPADPRHTPAGVSRGERRVPGHLPRADLPRLRLVRHHLRRGRHRRRPDRDRAHLPSVRHGLAAGLRHRLDHPGQHPPAIPTSLTRR